MIGQCVMAGCHSPVKAKDRCQYHYNRAWQQTRRPKGRRIDSLPDVVSRSDTAILTAITGGAVTFTDIANTVGLSRTGAYDRCRRLQTLGFIDWEPGLYATLTLTCRVVLGARETGRVNQAG